MATILERNQIFEHLLSEPARPDGDPSPHPIVLILNRMSALSELHHPRPNDSVRVGPAVGQAARCPDATVRSTKAAGTGSERSDCSNQNQQSGDRVACRLCCSRAKRTGKACISLAYPRFLGPGRPPPFRFAGRKGETGWIDRVRVRGWGNQDNFGSGAESLPREDPSRVNQVRQLLRFNNQHAKPFPEA